MNPTPHVLAHIGFARAQQDAEWGQQDHCDGTGPDHLVFDTLAASLAAHYARQIRHRNTEMGIVTWRDIFSDVACTALATADPAQLRTALVNTAALTVAWIEAIDRRTNPTQTKER
ncbi:hypothetical protein ACIP96_06450 [Streptomyces nigra]|uniref:hypothetical protein n=1 Tax=Streptomyces nigra TaxID=1827580 RepID=UPI00380416A0